MASSVTVAGALSSRGLRLDQGLSWGVSWSHRLRAKLMLSLESVSSFGDFEDAGADLLSGAFALEEGGFEGIVSSMSRYGLNTGV